MKRVGIPVSTLRATSVEFAVENPILKKGEIGLETDTKKYKIGDGETKWNDLDYQTALPTVTVSDNGKVLAVSSGAWAVTEPSGGGVLILNVGLEEVEDDDAPVM